MAGEARAGSDVPLLSNAELARIFHQIGDMLEVQGELVFKTVAYHRAADAIAHSPVEVARAYREGHPPRIPGVGAAISKKLEELATTGRLAYYERLREEVPPSLVELLEIPGVGPRTVKLLYEQRGIETLDDLRRAAEAGHLRDLRGMSERTEAAILDGIAQLQRRQQRMRLGEAERFVGRIVAALQDTPGLRSLVPAGSFRRRQETIGDLDLLASTDDPGALVDRFVGLPSVERVIGAGLHKASVRLRDGPQVDLMVMPPGAEGTYLVHFTGSKAHNVRLRSRARDRGWSLSEKGYLRLGPDGEPVEGAGAELRTFATEEETYAFLDLPWIPPELREDRGEIEAAGRDALPTLIERGDLKGDLHVHTNASDGLDTLERMVAAAQAQNLSYIAITDHAKHLGIVHGLDAQRLAIQAEAIEALNERLRGFRILKGAEVDILEDGRLALPDAVLERLDVVVVAVHDHFGLSEARQTSRLLRALERPFVSILAHPSGRLIGEREPYAFDFDKVLDAVSERGGCLEVNGQPTRLDLDDGHIKAAVERGVLLSVASDAHSADELVNLDGAVRQARRGWARPRDVLNTRTHAGVRALLRKR